MYSTKFGGLCCNCMGKYIVLETFINFQKKAIHDITVPSNYRYMSTRKSDSCLNFYIIFVSLFSFSSLLLFNCYYDAVLQIRRSKMIILYTIK